MTDNFYDGNPNFDSVTADEIAAMREDYREEQTQNDGENDDTSRITADDLRDAGWPVDYSLD